MDRTKIVQFDFYTITATFGIRLHKQLLNFTGNKNHRYAGSLYRCRISYGRCQKQKR